MQLLGLPLFAFLPLGTDCYCTDIGDPTASIGNNKVLLLGVTTLYFVPNGLSSNGWHFFMP